MWRDYIYTWFIVGLFFFSQWKLRGSKNFGPKGSNINKLLGHFMYLHKPHIIIILTTICFKKKWGHQDIYRISIQWGDNLRKITIHLRFLMTQCSICRLLIFYDNSISVSLFWIADLLRVKPEQSEAAVCIKQAVGFLHLLVSWSRLSVYPSVYISFIRLSFLVITLIYYNNLSIS